MAAQLLQIYRELGQSLIVLAQKLRIQLGTAGIGGRMHQQAGFFRAEGTENFVCQIAMDGIFSREKFGVALGALHTPQDLLRRGGGIKSGDQRAVLPGECQMDAPVVGVGAGLAVPNKEETVEFRFHFVM